MKRLLLASLFLLVLTWQANAAACFWVGGGSHVWSTTASWASSTGGTASTCAATGGYPHNSGDTATLDGSSGGGTVTFDATLNLGTAGSITMGAFTGTLDNSANNVSVALGTFSGTGSGTRTLNLGSGTFTIQGVGGTAWNMATTTGLTFNAGTSTIAFSSTNSNFAGGGLTYNIVAFSGQTGVGAIGDVISGANTFATINITGSINLEFPSSITTTITNAITWNGSSGNYLNISSSTVGTTGTVALSASGNTGTWLAIRDLTFTTNTPVFSSSFDLRHNTGATISAPTGGGGGGFVGLIGGS